MTIVAVVLGIALVSADTFINAVGVLRTFVTQYSSWWIVLCAFLCFAVCIFVAVTKLGSIRLGGKDAKPAFSYFSWFAMLFAATGRGRLRPGVLFGGRAYHDVRRASPFAPRPLFAGDTALAWTYFHWAIPAWAIYAIVSLFMAYARYNMHKDTTFRGTVEDLFPARAKRPVGIVVEILVVIATVFYPGLTTSLGLASYQFNSGIQQIFNIQTGQALQVAFVILFGSIATMSVWFGVVGHHKKISNANAVMSIVFVAAVFIFGPTLYILGVLPESLSVFIDQFMLMSGFTEAVNLGAGIASYGDSWQAFWSFFIFCWCFAFATFTAGFVSTISRGRTLREFVGGVVFVPAAVCIVWTCVVGGTGVWAAMSDPGIVAQTNADSSMGLFLTIDSVPLIGGVLTVLATILIGGYIVTSVDSGVMALSNFVSPAARQSRGFKALLALCITALAVLFMVTAGQDFLSTIQFATIAGGIPFSVIVILMGVQFFKWVKHDEQLVERGLAEPFPEDSLAARQLRQWHEEREAREAEKAWLTRHEEVDVPDGAGLDESMKEVSR